MFQFNFGLSNIHTDPKPQSCLFASASDTDTSDSDISTLTGEARSASTVNDLSLERSLRHGQTKRHLAGISANSARSLAATTTRERSR